MSIKARLTRDGIHSLYLTCLLVTVSVFIGCSTDSSDADAKTGETHAEGHDEQGDHPETYDEAVEAVVGMDAEIKDAFEKDDTEAAHGPLHKIGHVLEEVNELAEKTDLSDEQRKSVATAVEQLFEAFGAVDAVMHGKDGKTYDEVAGQIQENLEILKSMKPAASEG